MYPQIGVMPMPMNFRYKEVLQRGRPVHPKWDDFLIKHPPMAVSRWAKIFSPFDALEGFDERIARQEVTYEAKRDLCEDDAAELNHRLDVLHNYTWNSRMAKANHVIVTVTHFVPCSDVQHRAFGLAGRYESITGMVLGVGENDIRLKTDTGEKRTSFDAIQSISGAVFDSKQ